MLVSDDHGSRESGIRPVAGWWVRASAPLFAALLFTLLLPHPSPSAAAPVVQMVARGGFDGAGKAGGWLPVTIDIRNDGDDVDGEIQIVIQDTQTNRGTYTPAPTIYSSPVILARRSRKQIQMDVRVPTSTQRIRARLFDGESMLLEQDVQFSRVAGGDLLCGLMTRTGGALEYIPAIELAPPLRRVRIARIEANELPARPQLMNSLDCIIVDNYPTAAISDPQRDALRTWVSNGGLLIVAGGPGWQKTLAGLPADLLPVRVTGVTTIDTFNNLREFGREALPRGIQYLASAAVVTDGNVVVEEAGVPIIAAARRGLGAVFYLGLDPAAEPLRGWTGTATLWRYMFAHTATSSTMAPGGSTPFSGWGRTPRNAMVDIGALAPPSPGTLLAVLGAFAFVIGPINFLILQRLGQPAWAVVTIPLISGIATLFAFGVAAANRDSDAIATRVAIVRSFPHSQVAHAHTYTSLLSKQLTTYDVRGPEGSLMTGQFFPFPRDQATEGSSWGLKVRSGPRPEVVDLTIQPGSLTTFTLDSQTRGIGSVETDLWTDGRSIQGSITNRTGYELTDAVMVLDFQVYPSAGGRINLRPGETHEISGFDLQNVASAGYGPPQNFAAAVYPSTQNKKPSETARRDLLDSVFGTTFNLPKLELHGPTLLGWIEGPAAELDIKPGRSAFVDNTLLAASVPVRMPKGYEGEVPAALVSHRPLGATTATRQQWGSYDLAPGESVALQYNLPVQTGRFIVERLNLNVDGRLRGPGSAAARLGDIQLYNWRLAEWEEQPLRQGSSAAQNPLAYISATGDVRLRYTFKPAPDAQVSGISFTRLDVSVAGLMR